MEDSKRTSDTISEETDRTSNTPYDDAFRTMMGKGGVLRAAFIKVKTTKTGGQCMGRFFSMRLRQFTENSADFLTYAVYNKLKTESYCETCNYFPRQKGVSPVLLPVIVAAGSAGMIRRHIIGHG